MLVKQSFIESFISTTVQEDGNARDSENRGSACTLGAEGQATLLDQDIVKPTNLNLQL